MSFANVFLIILFLNSGLCEECSLPELPEEFYASKVEGSWFLTLHTNNELDDAFSCKRVTLKKTELGLSLQYVDFISQKSGPVNEYVRLKPGIYLPVGDVWKDMARYTTKLEEGKGIDDKTIAKTIEQEISVDNREQFFITDYESFFIGVVCGEQGRKFVWVETKHQHPTARDVLSIRNCLISLGQGWSQAKLYLTGCTTIPVLNSTQNATEG